MTTDERTTDDYPAGWLYVETDDGTTRYPTTLPYVQYDLGCRPAHELDYLVVAAVREVLGDAPRAQEYADITAATLRAADVAHATAARELAAIEDWLDSRDGATWGHADPHEELRYSVEDAENLPGISVDWSGDAGTVTVTLAAGWQSWELDEDEDEDED